MQTNKSTQFFLIGLVLVYLTLLLFIPGIYVFYGALREGISVFLESLGRREFQQALRMTLITVAIADPLNIIFGLCAAWAITHKKFRGRTFLLSVIDLPFSISPVVAGLMLVLLYGRNGWLGSWLEAIGFKVIFALPGIVLATSLVTLPFVVREVIPLMEEIGQEQEVAARTLGASEWQIFRRVTLPSIRWGLIYGVVLTNARSLGEFGAVAVVSGSILGRTATLPVFVELAFKNYLATAAFAAAAILALIGIASLVAKEILAKLAHQPTI
jgi:sulfate transport system permease protein